MELHSSQSKPFSKSSSEAYMRHDSQIYERNRESLEKITALSEARLFFWKVDSVGPIMSVKKTFETLYNNFGNYIINSFTKSNMARLSNHTGPYTFRNKTKVNRFNTREL